MSVNINYVGLLRGLRSAAIALGEFEERVKGEVDTLRKQDTSLTESQAINIVLTKEEELQMLSMLNCCKTDPVAHKDIHCSK